MWNGGQDLSEQTQSCELFCSAKTTENPYRYCGRGLDYTTGDFLDCTACADDKKEEAPLAPLEIAECPSECKYPKCVIGAAWNGGEDLSSASKSCQAYCSATTNDDHQRYCGRGSEYTTGDFVDCTTCALGDTFEEAAMSQSLSDNKRHCPSECGYPNCLLGSPWNGGLELNKGTSLCEGSCSAKTEGNPYRYCGRGPEYITGDFVDCTACASTGIFSSVASAEAGGTADPSTGEAVANAESSASASPTTPEAMRGFSLHDIVGEDGVLVLSMQESTHRFRAAQNALGLVNVQPILFPAISFNESSREELELGCRAQNEATRQICAKKGKAGEGCATKAEQAIAVSHKYALEQAARRTHNWTAVFEDDVAPLFVHRDTWREGLRKAWLTIPNEAKIVRLGWCEGTPETVEVIGVASHVPSEPFAAYHSPSGGCTHAYVVHKSIIPELLGLFPCCCPLDCCWELDYFDRPDPSGRLRSKSVLIDIDIDGSADRNYQQSGQAGWFGIATQNRREFSSIREASFLSS
jgi:hypothetical protein